MSPLILAFAASASAPSAEALRLGRQLAEQGALGSLLPMMKLKETEELLKEYPDLTAAEQTQLRATADRVFKTSYNRLMAATGNAYAEQLSIGDLRALTRFYGSPVAAKYRAATPIVIMATMKSVGQLDFKGDVRAAFCAQTRRLCSK